MHSSDLRGSDFDIALGGQTLDHAQLFSEITVGHRLGLVCPSALDGLGAASLLLASVTAFYDGYRAMGGDFFAYPDFFAFQLAPPAARYGRFDIWPDNKNVSVKPTDLTNAITDRGVQTLILPQAWSGPGDLQPEQQASLQRNLVGGWAYGPAGCVEDADLVIRCMKTPLEEWAQIVTATVSAQPPTWYQEAGDDRFQQSFRQLSSDDTISRL